MEILTADNGTLALAVAHLTVPDVIVTDVDMPDMDGPPTPRVEASARSLRQSRRNW
jgi:CheY-like chemotaxis protein